MANKWCNEGERKGAPPGGRTCDDVTEGAWPPQSVVK